MPEKIASQECAVKIPVGKVLIEGDLCLPEKAVGLVVFAHGSGSSRLSPRNTYVADVLRRKGLGTLLFDLLTEEEDESNPEARFDIPLIARRLVVVTDWVKKNEKTANLEMGYFGASTGAAAALIAAVERPDIVRTVVSRGGRPDLAMPVLPRVKASVLLIVGGYDYQVIEMNREALAALVSEKKLVIIPGATHLFEEPGTLEEVARLAGDWFTGHLTK
jgi:dienelactone hydrolase